MIVETILATKGREVRTVRPEVLIGDAVRRLSAERVGALVVSEDGSHISGIVSDRGIMNAIAERGIGVMEQTIETVMTPKVFTCSAQDRVSAIMVLMTERRIRHIPVVDEEGRLGGIISIGDVVKSRLDEIESEAAAMREYISGGA